jgi:hypothetical protein
VSDPSKRMLFTSPAFFGYEYDIKRAVESYGIVVDYFDERPSNSSLAKALFRVSGRLAQAIVSRHFRKILFATQHHTYDYVLVVKGEVVPLSFLQEIRRRNPAAHFVYYSYDAIPAGSNCTRLFGEFDRLFSFDPVNVSQYSQLRLKPLFYAPEFQLPEPKPERTYELSFVGTMHSDRRKFVTNLLSAFASTYSFFYVPARWYFFVRKYITRDFVGVAWSEVSFDKLGKSEVASIFQSSKAVLDLQRTEQSGLTMRTFEVLASGAILITGNKSIRDSDIYDADRRRLRLPRRKPRIERRNRETPARLRSTNRVREAFCR